MLWPFSLFKYFRGSYNIKAFFVYFKSKTLYQEITVEENNLSQYFKVIYPTLVNLMRQMATSIKIQRYYWGVNKITYWGLNKITRFSNYRTMIGYLNFLFICIARKAE